MYLRRCYQQKDGKRHGYWALVKSYRASRGPRQRVLAVPVRPTPGTRSLGALGGCGPLHCYSCVQESCARNQAIVARNPVSKEVFGCQPS